MTAAKKTFRRRLAVAVAMVFAACGDTSTPATGSGPQQWSLPGRLREISGLALTADERLLAVDDETAVVYELDYREGKLVKAFAFGDPVLKGDFEGIAVLEDRVWLMTSDGELFVADEGTDGEVVEFESFDTALGEDCELEGLAELSAENALLLVCKNGRDRGKLRMYRWHSEAGLLDEVTLPESAMEDALGANRVNPTGIALRPGSDERVVLTGIQRAVFGVSPDGDLNGVIMRLGVSRHRQAEGIAITRGGDILIADEGGNGRARLAVYRAQSANAADGNNKN